MTKVYTVTLSPAIDYILKTEKLMLNQTNRPSWTKMYAAGKGINISMMLNNFSVDNEAIVFTSGDFENFYLHQLDQQKVKYQNFASAEQIRINLKLIDDNNQTEMSIQGPAIEETEITKLITYLKEVLTKDDVLILTGTKPSNLDDNVYQEIGQVAKMVGAKLIVDAYGPTLLKSLANNPWLIKPNTHELELTYHQKINNFADLKTVCAQLIADGAENVLVSQGEKGAILFQKNQVLTASIPEIDETKYQLVSASGAGDSMIAGFLAAYLKDQDYWQALKMSIISGTATAYSLTVANEKLINELKSFDQTIHIKEIV